MIVDSVPVRHYSIVVLVGMYNHLGCPRLDTHVLWCTTSSSSYARHHHPFWFDLFCSGVPCLCTPDGMVGMRRWSSYHLQDRMSQDVDVLLRLLLQRRCIISQALRLRVRMYTVIYKPKLKVQEVLSRHVYFAHFNLHWHKQGIGLCCSKIASLDATACRISQVERAKDVSQHNVGSLLDGTAYMNLAMGE